MKKIFFWLSLFFLCWLAGMLAFVREIPTLSSEAQPVDAIVVLTGGKGRLETGLTLLADGKAEMMFISGVGGNTKLGDLLRHIPPALRQRIEALPPSLIDLGHEAENTIGNAEETRQWVRRNHIQSLLLVTANYHMPRALLEFSETLPDVRVTAIPVLSEDFSSEYWWKGKESRERVFSEYHKFLAAKSRHWLMRL